MKKTRAAKKIGVSLETFSKAYDKLKKEEPKLKLPDQWPAFT